VVFASCFPGTTASFAHARNNGADAEGRFDRRFLFQVLNMGHAQFAQHTGIRGPNSTINVACASSTAAFSIAEDWLANDRADRVVIISSDNVTSPELWSWIGAGFAASGAASSSNVVEEAALPFDRRRNGLILGMGAAAFVVERNAEAAERGVQPYAELLGTRMANSAFHGTRLDVDHVAQTVDGFVGRMEQTWGLDRHAMAPNTVFFSHETYTPARGGSAQSEVKALRTTFGESTDKILIANTKGFTGHPMGVGIEDASMIHGLHHRRFPPIANHKEVDPELGDLNLSKGGSIDGIEYGIRFGAGFGSQIALSLVRRWPVEGERVDGRAVLAWNRRLAGTNDVVLRVLDNKLVAYVDGENNLHGGVQGNAWGPSEAFEGIMEEPEQAPTPTPVPSPAAPAAPAAPAPTSTPVSDDEVTAAMIEVVVEHTGYPAEFIEMDQDLEGELGIDTVKQAEIMASLRDRFSLPVDEDFVLSDHPTLNHMLAYLTRMQGGASAPTKVAPAAPASPVQEAVEQPKAPTPAAPVEAPASAPMAEPGELVDTVVSVVVEHTGYPADFIELDQDLEGELGIDTVKQAEIMADIRARFSLPIDEDFLLSDHPTLNHMVAYIQRMTGGEVHRLLRQRKHPQRQALSRRQRPRLRPSLHLLPLLLRWTMARLPRVWSKWWSSTRVIRKISSNSIKILRANLGLTPSSKRRSWPMYGPSLTSLWTRISCSQTTQRSTISWAMSPNSPLAEAPQPRLRHLRILPPKRPVRLPPPLRSRPKAAAAGRWKSSLAKAKIRR